MHGEIGIALSVALLGIRESRVPNDFAVHDLFLPKRQGSQGFREQLIAFDANRHLAGLGAEQWTLDADDVTNVQELERTERILSEYVTFEVQLNAATFVREMREGRLSVSAPRHEPAR